jgi:hypothetical protein
VISPTFPGNHRQIDIGILINSIDAHKTGVRGLPTGSQSRVTVANVVAVLSAYLGIYIADIGSANLAVSAM